MLEIRKILETVYMEHRKAFETFQMPVRGYTSSDKTKVKASALDECELRVARERLKVPFSNPEVDPNKDVVKATLMDQGSKIAEAWQTALLYYASRTQGFAAQVEVPLAPWQGGALTGIADAIIDVEGEQAVLEFKFTLNKDNGPGDPSFSHALQTLVYADAFGMPGYIVTLGKGDFKVWSLEPTYMSDRQMTGFTVHDTMTGDPLSSFFATKWNKPQHLNMKTVQQRASRILEIMDMVDTGVELDPPIDIEDGEYWRCCEKDRTTPRCPYFDLCHPFANVDVDDLF